MQTRLEPAATLTDKRAATADKRSTDESFGHSDGDVPAIAAAERLRSRIRNSLSFQRRWQRLSMGAYVSSTVGVLLTTTLATYFAAREQAQLAALLAASSAVLIGLEKSLLFREKWKFHLFVATKLSIIQIKLELAECDVDQLTVEYIDVLSGYANSIPISARDNQ